jgi:transcriptional regulator with XRE-family HTH domain
LSVTTGVPSFNGPSFAAWLRRWKDAEGLAWADIAERGGLSMSTLAGIAAGDPPAAARRRGQTEINPGVNALARIAYALGLELSYVLAKGGLTPRYGDRWANFTREERAALLYVLRDTRADDGPVLVGIVEELQLHYKTTTNEEPA